MSTKSFKKVILPFLVLSFIIMSTTSSHAALGDQVLSAGMSNPDINQLQHELKDLGFFINKNTSTYYGFFTELAVKGFQKSRGLEPTGVYDKATHNALLEKKAEIIQELKDQNKLLSYNRNLKFKNKGNDVLLLQEKLKDIGFLKINKCTNYYGEKTKQSVELFQKAYGLKVTGVADKETITIINRVLLGELDIKPVPKINKPKNNNKIVNIAKSLQGARYSFGANGPNSFDCSGFTRYVYNQVGISIPRTTRGQATVGKKVNKANLQPGDLIIFSGTYRRGPSHAGVYIGNGKFIHASTSRGVTTDSINSRYYSSKFSYGRRLK